jgi:hypothetical protein
MMAKFIIPENGGPYQVVRSMPGTPLVENDRSGKSKVRIPCKTWEPEEICRRLNENDHDGVIHA